MGDIISLKVVRKAKQREDKESLAAANRAKFGQSKTEKKLSQAKTAKAKSDLDGHKRET